MNKGDTNLSETNCERGDNADFYRWAFFYGPLWFSIIFCIIIMILVYKKIQKTESKMKSYTFIRESMLRVSAIMKREGNEEREESKPGIISRLFGKKPATATRSQKMTQLSGSEEVKRQSFRYSTAYFVVWTFPTIARIIQLSGKELHPIMIVLAGTFIGSQGLWNAMIYFRPRYIKCHKYDKPYRKVWALIQSTLFFCCYDEDYTKDKLDDVADSSNNKTQDAEAVSDEVRCASDSIEKENTYNEDTTTTIRFASDNCSEEEKQEEI